VYVTSVVPELGNWETAYEMTPRRAYKPELEGDSNIFAGQGVISLCPTF
jgi:hypothetical protein